MKQRETHRVREAAIEDVRHSMRERQAACMRDTQSERVRMRDREGEGGMIERDSERGRQHERERERGRSSVVRLSG